MRHPWWRRRNRVPRKPVGQIITIEEQDLGIIDLGTELSQDLRSEIFDNILTHGKPFNSGGVLGAASLPLLGAGSTVASSLFAGNIFLATANPATLMTIGAGYGSAVMGVGGGIAAQAPFVAASSAIIPVVAPIMFFMVVSSMMMSARFDQIQVSLTQLGEAVEQLLKREFAEDFGNLLSAMERLRDISAEFDGTRRFSDEMKIRLALVEKDINMMHHKYDILQANPVGSLLGAKTSVFDIGLFAYSSIADIQVDGLRLKLALQDNPVDATRSYSMLNSKIDRYEISFRKILEKDEVKLYKDKLWKSVQEMGWWKKNVWTREYSQKINEIREVDQIRDGSLDKIRLNIAQWSKDRASMRDAGTEQSVLYYRDHDGKGELKAYYTSDWKLQKQY